MLLMKIMYLLFKSLNKKKSLMLQHVTCNRNKVTKLLHKDELPASSSKRLSDICIAAGNPSVKSGGKKRSAYFSVNPGSPELDPSSMTCSFETICLALKDIVAKPVSAQDWSFHRTLHVVNDAAWVSRAWLRCCSTEKSCIFPLINCGFSIGYQPNLLYKWEWASKVRDRSL